MWDRDGTGFGGCGTEMEQGSDGVGQRWNRVRTVWDRDGTGFGRCGTMLGQGSEGVGQRWDRVLGRNVVVDIGCDNCH